LGYEPNELPDCSTPHNHGSVAIVISATKSLIQYKMSLKQERVSNTR
jgi:hypothetical protein